MTTKSGYPVKFKMTVAAIIILTLLLLPAPLLPPYFFAEAIQSFIGISLKTAYLVTTIGLQALFFFSIGILSAFVVNQAATLRRLLIQILVVPVIIVFVALTIRSVKVGHLPVWINAVIPIVACVLGVWLGLGLLYHRGKIILFILIVVMGATFWVLSRGTSPELTRATEIHLKKLVDIGSTIPPGEARFGELFNMAFATPSEEPGKMNAVQNNRAAILALGIALGDERLAKYAGLNIESGLMQQVVQLREGTTLRGRADWPRHFCLSAALAVLKHQVVSDAGGLMKEQLDALAKGSGFSFCDFAADRAGVRFAAAATNSEEDAKAMQDFLKGEFVVDNFFPPVADLPENLTTEQFRSDYGAVGSKLYREKIIEIENRLNNCVALSPLHISQKQK